MTDRYRKKPVEVRAWKIGDAGQQLDWVREAFDDERIDWCPAGEGLYINTLEGRMKANIGDMLIEGVKGELYSCRADIFAATYEPVAQRYADSRSLMAMEYLDTASTGVGNMDEKQTPLIDLLERVPQDAQVAVEHDQFSSSSHPVGRLCHEAAAELRRLHAEVEWLKPMAAVTLGIGKGGGRFERLSSLDELRAALVALRERLE